MSLARIHDRQHIKTFWENRIHVHDEHATCEEQRRNASALHKQRIHRQTTRWRNQTWLRGEWLTHLEKRNTHLKNLKEPLVHQMKL
ncbi:uncharacterized protein LOC133632701 [Entelurus aequoreus]|uniref:uncharacterized protein LOC133632701 n=1 Tax=Entelurus aequoreus TaxID=161455 RepID=UPI002B1DC29C|nr:uncharacterized protein LOC133632701 [Entelurus aequoreus]XP_061881281.1 uncharacterized protein LOC133632701 [Entelurus aequoreus]